MATKEEQRKKDPRRKKLLAVVSGLAIIFVFIWTNYSELILDKLAETGIITGTAIEGKHTETGAVSGGTDVVWTEDSAGNYYSTGYGPERIDDAVTKLAALPDSDKRTKIKYNRKAQFGESWKYDFDNSGCRTRADIMQWQMAEKVMDGCEVREGIVTYDPYTGRKDVFVPNSEISKKWDIEHIVALADVWRSGAHVWMVTDSVPEGVAKDPQERREQIANDPINLMLVDGGENKSKSDKVADEWLVPNNSGYVCEYAQRQVFIKDKYALGVSQQERAVLDNTLYQCKL